MSVSIGVVAGEVGDQEYAMIHIPVMEREVLRYLIHANTRTVLEATLGCGGHARAILESNPDVRLIGVDWDGDALRIARAELKAFTNRVRFALGNFADVDSILGAEEKVDGVLADLGLSSLQLDSADRGFSYSHDGPLDMRMTARGETAKSLLARSSVAELTLMLQRYGEVIGAKRLARAIHAAAQRGDINTTGDLKRLIELVLGRKATPAVLSQVFQAVRIALGGELDNLTAFLSRITRHLNKDARIVIVSYHSLEDRIIKDFFKRESRDCICPPGVPVCVCVHKASLQVLTRRVVTPSAREVEQNPRSRSAKLRAAKFINEESVH